MIRKYVVKLLPVGLLAVAVFAVAQSDLQYSSNEEVYIVGTSKGGLPPKPREINSNWDSLKSYLGLNSWFDNPFKLDYYHI